MPNVAVRSCGNERGVFFDFWDDIEVANGVVFQGIEPKATAYQKDEKSEATRHVQAVVYDEECDEDEL